MMRRIFLYGALAEKYGKEFRFNAPDVNSVVRLMEANFPGFTRFIRNGTFRIVAGKNFDDPKAIEIEKGLTHLILGKRDLHIMPVAAGAGGKGIFKIILGIVLIAAAFVMAPAAAYTAAGSVVAGTGMGATAFAFGSVAITYTNIALFGASLLLGGLAEMLTPMPKIGGYNDRDDADERASFLFNGAVNTTEQGAAVPVIYGRMRTGSVVISGQILSEQI